MRRTEVGVSLTLVAVLAICGCIRLVRAAETSVPSSDVFGALYVDGCVRSLNARALLDKAALDVCVCVAHHIVTVAPPDQLGLWVSMAEKAHLVGGESSDEPAC